MAQFVIKSAHRFEQLGRGERDQSQEA